MARDVDRVIDFIRAQEQIPPVHRQVMVDRVEGRGEPDAVELERARAKVYPDEPARSELDGATEPSAENAQSATPGEFAARWNAATEEQRAGWLRAMRAESERATLCKLRHTKPTQHDGIAGMVADAETAG